MLKAAIITQRIFPSLFLSDIDRIPGDLESNIAPVAGLVNENIFLAASKGRIQARSLPR